MPLKETTHRIITGPAQQMRAIENESVQLVVTSPPYPMIEMWDDIMATQNPAIGEALKSNKGLKAFELMHRELDQVWSEVHRVLSPGGFACINIGDATRTLNGSFALYANHARIISSFTSLGFSNLPNILWQKQTNAPNKFMGSGMLPAGAYVTLEHEWILVFRKGGKRIVKSEQERQLRRESAFFWEERNCWFSDRWDLKGIKQKLLKNASRERSAAYPFEIPYRLINMYSLKGDLVLDPFLGIGTTTLAAMASERNSFGYELEPAFRGLIDDTIHETPPFQLNQLIESRVNRHREFLQKRFLNFPEKKIKHFNRNLNMSVVTSQETGIRFSYVKNITAHGEGCFKAAYYPIPVIENSDIRTLVPLVGEQV